MAGRILTNPYKIDKTTCASANPSGLGFLCQHLPALGGCRTAAMRMPGAHLQEARLAIIVMLMRNPICSSKVSCTSHAGSVCVHLTLSLQLSFHAPASKLPS